MPSPIKALLPLRLKVGAYYLRMIWRCRRFEGASPPRQARRMARQVLAMLGVGRVRVAFAPDYPQLHLCILRKLLVLSGCVISRDPRDPRAAAVFKWRDALEPGDDPSLRAVAAVRRVENVGFVDVSKEYVESVFAAHFGYGAAVDPLAHEGAAVEKSSANARHDGRVITCPIAAAAPGKVYMRVIDNRSHERTVEDLRVPVLRGEIPLVYRKLRPIADRFSNTNSEAEVLEPREAFSAGELADIAEFCRKYPADYAELDVLRDRADGRIYIVDVSNTPYGPPNHLGPGAEIRALARLESACRRIYLGGGAGPARQ